MGSQSFHSAWIVEEGAVATSGAAGAILPWWSFTKTVIAVAALRLVEADRLDFEPGAGWSYSNVGYMFAGDAVAQAAGLPLGEALDALVIRPLDLPSPRFAAARADMAEVYWPQLRAYDPRWVYHGLLIG